MSFRRALNLAGLLCLAVVGITCGQVYRPVVIPCIGVNPVPGCTNSNPPTPGNFHTVFSLTSNDYYDSTNNLWNFTQGTSMQYDVSGDSTIGVTANNPTVVAANPTHAVITPGFGRIFVANAASVNPGAADSIGSFLPENSFSTSITPSTIFSLPTAPPGAPAGSTFPYLPDVVAATQGNFAFAANYGVDAGPVSTESISVLNASQNAVTNTVYLGANLHPVSLAETFDSTKLYAGTQGIAAVFSFNTVDMSQNSIALDPSVTVPFPGSTPIWMVGRADSQKIYIVTQGNGATPGELFTLDVATDTVKAANPVGVGPNYVMFDPKLDRLYVTNPATSTVYIFSASGPGDVPLQLAAITIPSSVGCATCSAPAPVSVTALADGSRAYVASYQLDAACLENDPANTSACLVYPQVTVIDEASNTIKTTLSPLPAPVAPNTQQAVTEMGPCIASSPIAYNPGVVTLPAASAPSVQSVRFRVAAAASADSTRVYVSVCDAQMVATINTTDKNINGGNHPPDSLVANLPTPTAGCSGTCTTTPRQTPVLVLAGQ
jgi:hypothetical protein